MSTQTTITCDFCGAVEIFHSGLDAYMLPSPSIIVKYGASCGPTLYPSGSEYGGGDKHMCPRCRERFEKDLREFVHGFEKKPAEAGG